MKLEGYIIIDLSWPDNIALEMGYSSFGKTASEAWTRHLGVQHRGARERSTYIQRWSDMGYGPRKVTIEMDKS